MTTRKVAAVRSSAPRTVTELNKVARQLVDAHSGAIASALLRATIGGHSLSAQILLRLAEIGVDIEAALDKRPQNTIAMRLGAERQYATDDPAAKEGKDVSRTALLTV